MEVNKTDGFTRAFQEWRCFSRGGLSRFTFALESEWKMHPTKLISLFHQRCINNSRTEKEENVITKLRNAVRVFIKCFSHSQCRFLAGSVFLIALQNMFFLSIFPLAFKQFTQKFSRCLRFFFILLHTLTSAPNKTWRFFFFKFYFQFFFYFFFYLDAI